MSNRRGVSLVEVIVMIGMSMALMGIAVKMLHSLLRFERSGGESLVISHNRARLAAQFRDDVHAATAATVERPAEGTSQLQLKFPDAGVVTYRQSDRSVLRTSTAADAPGNQEEFRLPAATRVKFAVSHDNPPATAVLICEPVTAETSTSPAAQSVMRRPYPVRIEAVIAKDRRFTGEGSP